MHVTDLQHFLGNVAALVRSADTKGSVVSDLEATVKALAPFAEMPLSELSDLLLQAKDYRDNGRIGEEVIKAILAARTPSRGKGVQKVKPPLDLEAELRKLRDLYDRVPELGLAPMRAELVKIEKALTAGDYKELAKRFGVVPQSSKPKTTEAIYNKIGERFRDSFRNSG